MWSSPLAICYEGVLAYYLVVIHIGILYQRKLVSCNDRSRPIPTSEILQSRRREPGFSEAGYGAFTTTAPSMISGGLGNSDARFSLMYSLDAAAERSAPAWSSKMLKLMPSPLPTSTR